MTGDAGRCPAEPGWPGGRVQGAATGGGEQPPVLDQVFDGNSLYALREAVAAHASQAGLPEGRVGDLVLAVHELAANAVWHGARHGRLRMWKTEDALRLEVSDDGTANAARPGDAGFRVGLRRAGRADHGAGANRCAARGPDGGGRAARSPAPAAARRRPGRRIHLG
jgi:anti-sigma regulatory factor (Ser/Thr protein kinase)